MPDESRSWFRALGSSRRVTLLLGDDTGAMRHHQIEGFAEEVRNGIQNLGAFGFSGMPLSGAKGVLLFQGGHPGLGSLIGIEDPRYRPRGLNPGEFLLYAVTGADAKGAGGTMKPILKGTTDGHGKLTGIVIDIGDSDTTTVNITGSSKVIVKAPDVEVSNGGTAQPVKLADGSNSTVLKAQ